jgi:hypothetical protein
LKNQSRAGRDHMSMLVFFLLLLMLVYQNCGGARVAQENLVSKVDEGQIKELRSLSNDQKHEFCKNSKNYRCVLSHFAPEIEYSKTESLDCIQLPGIESLCVPTLHLDFNSKYALDHCDDCGPVDGDPGGKFNYFEATCFNTEVRGSENFPLKADGSTLEESLWNVVTSCEILIR